MTVPTRICCAVDFAAPSRAAMRRAAALAKRLGAELTLFHAVEVPAFIVPGSAVEPEELGRSATDEAERVIGEWQLEASTILGRPVQTHVVAGEPHRAILGFLRDQRCDLVVAAMNEKRGLKERTLGSVAERLLRDAPCPVLVDRPLLTRVEQAPARAA